MSALHKKLFRELWQLRGQVVSIALVIACSVSVFVALLCTLRSLRAAVDAHYEDAHFADVFAQLRRAPRSLETQLRAIPGVGEVDVRATADVRLEVAGFTEPIVGHLVSVPRGGSRLDRTVLRRGRDLDPARPGEVLVSEAFALAHKLASGDRLVAVINGRRATLSVAGVVLSPEFVFAVRPGEIVPDDRRFAVIWMNEDALGRAADLAGAFNSVAIALAPGASEREVIAGVDTLLAPFGGLGAIGRVDQLSHRNLEVKLKQLAVQAEVTPAVFLAVAAFLLNTVLARLIGTQRGVIATLRAFGYGRAAITAHYLEFVAAIVLLGAAVGLGLGVTMGMGMVSLYRQYYRLPALFFHLEPGIAIIGVGVSLAASITGAISAVLRAASLSPAEAMRPEAPRSFRPLLVERVLGPLLSPRSRMVLRQLARRPGRAALGVMGISFAVAIVVMSGFFRDSIDKLIEIQFFLCAHEDATVLFNGPVTGRARSELEHLPGVTRVEPLSAAPVRLVAGHRSRLTSVQALTPGGRLHPLLDEKLREITPPEDGILLSRILGEGLGVGPGDTISLELLEGTRAVRSLRVSGLVDELIGSSAYLDVAALGWLLDEQGSMTAAYLAVDELAQAAVVRRLEAMPSVSSVGLRRTVVKLFRSEIEGRMMGVTVLLSLFASVIAVGVVYNGARIALAERVHELGCMRVMGFTRGEVSALLLGELGLQVLCAIPIGWWLGHALAGAMSRGLATDAYRFPMYIEARTYAWSALVVLIAGALSALTVRRKIDGIDLGDVLRTRE